MQVPHLTPLELNGQRLRCRRQSINELRRAIARFGRGPLCDGSIALIALQFDTVRREEYLRVISRVAPQFVPSTSGLAWADDG